VSKSRLIGVTRGKYAHNSDSDVDSSGLVVVQVVLDHVGVDEVERRVVEEAQDEVAQGEHAKLK